MHITMETDKVKDKDKGRKTFSVRWLQYRNKGKSVDKRGRLIGHMNNLERVRPQPLTNSVSMDTVSSICGCSRSTSCSRSRLESLNCHDSSKQKDVLSSTKLKGKSCERLERLCCTPSHCDKGGKIGVGARFRAVSAPPIKSSSAGTSGVRGMSLCQWDASDSTSPLLPAPLQPIKVAPPHQSATSHTTNSTTENIYASRQEWLTMAKAHRSSLKEKLQEEFLSCKICLEPFMRPKALPCLHSFCQHCLQDYVRRHPGVRPGHFPCPMCRKDIAIPVGGIESFQDNFVLLSLSDTLEEDEVWHDPPHHHQLSPPRTIAPPSPLELKLRDCEWYFGKVSRNASEEWLLSTGYPKGSFLLRQGEASPDTLTLSVRDCDELRGYLVKHYKVFAKRSDKLTDNKDYYFITPKRMFKSLQDLVSHYMETADGLCCKLSQVCGKPRSLSWAQERGKDDEYTTSRDSIHLVKRIGSGQFADVWLGKWNGREVAVKIQRPDAVKMAAFLDEAQILKTLDHVNVLSLVATCCGKEPVYLVSEYLEHGRLSVYLRDGAGSQLPLTQLLWICAQVADGMAYMEKERFIHRNLGARNILVGEKNRVKIAGFGMTKCSDDPDFNFRRGLKMAIKWMAPEVLLYNKYSTKADVWSFGILMVEVFTHGCEPYEGMGSKEAFENVQQGYRMPRPQLCPQEIFDVMLSCWSTNPSSRPSCDFLNTFLHDWQLPS